ncbi:MAG: PhnD/SsuA/transferrin family substrate-binding protein [Deltaproteobacteria bacterium]|nr:PhnD/SsuA/transferrin family substrate-binding protein [Deltaproteobacteria bacterium]
MSSDDRPGSNPPLPDTTRLVFGFAPSVEGDRTRQALVDVCRVLGSAVGLDIAPMRVASYGALERAILEGRASFGWFPPVILARLELSGRVIPIAQCVRGGAASYHACLFVHGSSSITTIEELKGKRAVWVDRSSAAGYVFPRLLLAAHGLDPATAFTQETFAQSHAEVVRAVVEGSADVGATFATIQKDGKISRGGWTDPDGSNARPIKVLATFGPIPNDAMAASTALAPEVRDALARAAISSSSSPSLRAALRHLFGAEALAPVAEDTFSELRGLVARALKSGVVLDA